MGWTAYIKNGMVILPTSALTTDGLLINVEPIEIASLADHASIARSVLSVINRGIRTVPAPDPRSFQNSPLFSYVGVKSWSAFYKGTCQMGFMRGSNGFEVFTLKKSDNAAFFVVDEPTRKIIPLELTVSEVAAKIADEIRKFRTSTPRPTHKI